MKEALLPIAVILFGIATCGAAVWGGVVKLLIGGIDAAVRSPSAGPIVGAIFGIPVMGIGLVCGISIVIAGLALLEDRL